MRKCENVVSLSIDHSTKSKWICIKLFWDFRTNPIENESEPLFYASYRRWTSRQMSIYYGRRLSLAKFIINSVHQNDKSSSFTPRRTSCHGWSVAYYFLITCTYAVTRAAYTLRPKRRPVPTNSRNLFDCSAFDIDEWWRQISVF